MDVQLRPVEAIAVSEECAVVLTVTRPSRWARLKRRATQLARIVNDVAKFGRSIQWILEQFSFSKRARKTSRPELAPGE